MSSILKGLQLNELSPQTLASYKKKAGADATAADKEGDTKKADKRFSGIVKATKKEFDNDAKGVKEAYNNYHANRTGFTRPKRDLSGEGEPQGMFMVMIDGRPWKEFTSNVAFARAKTLADKNPTKKIQVRWPTGELNTVKEDELDENCWKGYHKEGNKKLFGKTVPNCVKNEDVSEGSEFDKWANDRAASLLHKLIAPEIKGKIQNIVSRLSDEYGMWDHKAQTFTPDGLEHLKSILKFNDKYIKYALSLNNRDFEAEGVAEGWTKTPSGDYINQHTGVRSSKPPVKKKRGEKTGAEWDAIEKAKKDKEQGVAEGSETYKQGHAKFHTKTNKQIGPTHYGRGSDKKADSYTKADPRYHEVRPVKEQDVAEEQHSCPHCGGEMVSEELMNEKKDACYYKVKSRYKVWPSAYASGALVKCRKKGASNWGNGGKKNESSILEGIEQVDENLHKWFKEKWVRFGPDGKIRGDCARGDDSEGKPKCLPQSKAQSLGKKGRASAAARKRREDPNPERSGKAINVNTKKKSNEGVAEASFTAATSMNASNRKQAGGKTAQPTHRFRVGDQVSTKDGKEGQVTFVHGNTVHVKGTNDYYPDAIKHYSSEDLKKGVAEGLNEFAPNGFNGDDGEEFNPRMAKMAYDEGVVKGVSLADGATLEMAMKINYWHTQHGGMYKQYFAKGFKAGRMNKVKHDNKQYNLNLKLMKDGSIRHGEQGVAEEQLEEKWSQKYKDSINCSNPKGFSQRAHCQGKNK